jgi:hypothetical protein
VCLIGWGIYTPITSATGFLNPPSAERELLRFLRTLPKDVLLAGSPCTLDNIPLFAHRRILFGCFYGNKGDTPIIPKALETYYANDVQALIDFCPEHNIDYLVVDLKTYSRQYLEQGQIFYEPYNQELLVRIAGRDTFVLSEISDDIKVFQFEDIFVVSCDKFEKSNWNNEFP